MITKEELRKIKLPLSDEDYVWIHEVALPAGIELRFVSKELDEAYDLKMRQIYFQLFQNDDIERDIIPWFPPQIEEYKDHPINVRLSNRRPF